jgi:hypothetical protein
MNITRFTPQILLLAVFIWAAGCATRPDPLAGWKPDFNTRPSDQIIEKDYQDYIQEQKLSPEKGKYVAYVECFEDGTGQHAVKITISLNHAVWEHVLIYDKDNKRIKTIKYHSGSVSC